MVLSVRPQIRVAVLMRREPVQGDMARWQPWRWVLADVVPHETGFGEQARCLRASEQEALWLYPNWPVELFTDDAEVAAYQLCKSREKTAAHYYKTTGKGKPASKTPTPACEDPGAYKPADPAAPAAAAAAPAAKPVVPAAPAAPAKPVGK